MATNILLEVSKDEEARAYYESELRFQLDQNSRYNHAIREGKREGRLEGKLEAARAMLADGLDIKKIVLYTGLSDEEIQNLKWKSINIKNGWQKAINYLFEI